MQSTVLGHHSRTAPSFFFIEVELISNIVLVSSVQHSDSGWFFFCRFFSIIGYYQVLNIVPCVIQ